MAKIKGIAHVALTISNIGISKPFYRMVFQNIRNENIFRSREESSVGMEVELES